MPVMLGFIVQSYMAAKLPGPDANKPAFTRGNSKLASPPPDGIGKSVNGISNVQREDSIRLQ